MSADLGDRLARLSRDQLIVLVKRLQAKLEEPERPVEPVAILGIGCRLPGESDSPEAFWRFLCRGEPAWAEIPADRWEVDAHYDPSPDAPGKMYCKWGCFLDGWELFDPDFFGISGSEAAQIDPQHRLLLEVSWEALEQAGHPPDGKEPAEVGVFAGMMFGDRQHAVLSRPEEIGVWSGLSAEHSVAAARVSYLLNLRGPCLAVSTACSSSLVAVHLACQSLRARECRLAIAGGTSLVLGPESGVLESKMGMLSPDGLCKTFDARANGMGRGEGAAAVVLKRLSDARADGDRILAVIRGSALNQDGRSAAMTAPNVAAQEDVIRRALAQARVGPERISYLECHGTGTALGDPIEVEAICTALGGGRPPDARLALGSVKTAIGHLEAAAGIAGLVKLVLALEHRAIPPHVGLRALNPQIALAEAPITVPGRLTPWTSAGTPRVGAVSSFGFSGTNAHLVVEEAPARPALPAAVERDAHLLCLAARSRERLALLAARFVPFLEQTPEPFADVCASALLGRVPFRHRLALVARSSEEAARRLAELASVATGEAPPGPAQVGFLFTGQGAQYPGMGRRLFETQPTYRAALTRCCELLDRHLPVPLLEVIQGGRGELLDQTAYTQPALFAIEHALAELWRSFGVVPAVVLGHSLGEITAACQAGVLGLEDAAALCAERGRLMQELPERGTMVAALASRAEVEPFCAAAGGRVVVAGENGPENTALSGEEAALARVVAALEARGVRCLPLRVSHAFHSPLMDPMLEAFERRAATLGFSAPGLPLISNLSGRVAGPEVASAAYWRRHVREPVRFHDGVQALVAQGCRVVIEIGPHPVLTALAERCVDRPELSWLPSLHRKREAWEQLLESLGQAYLHGVEIDWRGFERDYPRRRVHLPTSPFLRRRCLPEGPGPGSDPRLQRPPPATIWSWLEAAGREQAQRGLAELAPRRLLEQDRALDRVASAARAPEEELAAARLAARACGVEPETIAGVAGGEAAGLDPLAPGGYLVRRPDLARYLTTLRARLVEALDRELAPGLALRVLEVHAGRGELARQLGGLAARGALTVTEETAPGCAALAARVGAGVRCRALSLALEPGGQGFDPHAFDLIFATGLGALADPAAALRRLRGLLAAQGVLILCELVRPPRWVCLEERGDLAARLTGFLAEGFVRSARLIPESAGLPVELFLAQASSGASAGAPRAFSVPARPAARRAPSRVGSEPREGPFSRRRLAVATPTFEHRLAVDSPPLLGDHRVLGRAVLPAAAYLELALCADDGPPASLELARVVLDQALLLSDEGSIEEVELALFPGGEESPARFAIHASEAGVHRLLAHGELRRHALGEPPPCFDAEVLRRRLPALDPARFYRQLAGRGLEYGPAFRAAREIWRGEGEALALLERTAEPWRLLACDAGFQLLGAAAHGTSGALYLPVGVASVRWFADPPPRLLARLLVREETEERVLADLELQAEDGQGIARIAGLAVQRTRREALDWAPPPPAFAELVYTARWQIQEREATPERAPGRVVILADRARGVGAELGRQLAARGASPELVHLPEGADPARPEAYAALLDGLRGGDLLLLRGLEAAPLGPATTPEELCRGQELCSLSLLGLTRALAGFPEPPRLWIVTAGAQAIGEEVSADPGQATLWGLARSLVHEHPELGCRRLDLPAEPADEDLRVLVEELLAPTAETELATRRGARHVRRLRRLAPEPAAPFAPARDRSVLIVGGLGGLGLATARALCGLGVRQLALLGRRPPSISARAELDALERDGVRILVLSADLSREQELAAALAEIDATLSPLGGVIHAAAALDDGVLLEQTRERFATVFAPKLLGSWNLHRATLDRELGFFVLFSSAAALFGPPGQGSYAAGSAFQDALAGYRRGLGLPALSIGWGPWSEVGMAADRAPAPGLQPLSPERGLAILEGLLGQPRLPPQVVALHADWQAFRRGLPGPDAGPLLAELAPERSGEREQAPTRSLREQLEHAPPFQRLGLMRELLRGQLAEILPGATLLEADLRRNLLELGLDSLMAVDLRNRLRASLGHPVPATVIFNYPTIERLAQHLVEELLGLETTPAEPEAGAPELPGEDLEGLSEDEAWAALAAELDRKPDR